MKKILLLLLFFVSVTTYASHYMGGEITWQCLPNGNFRFILKLYRECNGITFNGSENLTVLNYPGLSSIQMTLKPGANPRDSAEHRPLDGKTDLSPNCWNGPGQPRIDCYPNPAIANTGAIEEWYFTSDNSYPNGVKLTGTPPSSGWVFSHTSCCRNPSTNLAFQDGWFLRAVMYPFNGQNTFPCYDNSPAFAESPATVLCSGGPYFYHTMGYDPDNDSLAYAWAPALHINMSTPVTYASGYSYNSPLPGPLHNPMNLAAIMNPYNGEISFTSYTNGAFVLVTKVAQYRHGKLIGEVFRELQTIILACTGSNTAPDMSAPFYYPNTGLMGYTDTVTVGDTIDFDLVISDTVLLPNGKRKTITLDASGKDFGTGYTNPSSGCPNPPCATLSPTLPVSDTNTITTHFHWLTNCGQMQNYAVDNNFAYSTHDFYFKAADNWCPVPANNTKIVTIVIKTPLIKPVVALVTTNFTIISWSFYNGFSGKYYIYRSDSTAPFMLIDSTNSNMYVDFSSLSNHIYQYKILAKDTNGCEWWSATCSTSAWTGIQSNETDKLIKIYPNPANNIITFETTLNNLQLQVYNLNGQLLTDKKLKAGINTIDIMNYTQGMYFYRLTHAERFLKSGKFVKE